MLRTAIRHPANYGPIIFCTISMVGVGILMIVLGVVIVLIDYIEMGPPQYDEQYDRYVGSNLAGILGPMFIIFGTLLVLGNLCTLAYAGKSYHAHLADQVDETHSEATTTAAAAAAR